jgi:hypothetical protein
MRRLPRAAAILLASVCLPVAIASSEDGFHTSPACWDGPRLYHAGPPSADVAARVHMIEAPPAPPSTPMPGEAAISPNGAYRFWVRNPDTTTTGPWGAGVIVDNEREKRLVLLIEEVAGLIAPHWINEKLILLRVAWGHAVFSDLIVDVERGEIVFHEQVHDGTIAWQQFQESCAGVCPCDVVGADVAPKPTELVPPVLTPSEGGSMPAATPGEGAVIGLVLLPTIFGPPERGGVVPAAKPVPVPVYETAEGGGRKLAELAAIDDFEYREYTYEGAAAVVYERRPGWYRIGIRAPLESGHDTAWISAKSTGGFLGLADLLVGSQAYLNEHWDGYVWTAPVQGMRTGLSKLKRDHDPNAREEYAARILAVREVGAGIWLRIETVRAACVESDPTAVVDAGWVPAYGGSGNLVAWFYSRGC